MLDFKQLPTQILDFTKKNYLWIILAVLFLVVVVTLSTAEGFQDLAEYPAIFLEKVSTPFLKENTFINYYLPAEKQADPVHVEMHQLDLTGGMVKVPIDVGNGLSVEALVKVKSQSVPVPEQNSVQLANPDVTDVVVESQTITIPKQVKIIPVNISNSEETIGVPVEIDSQTVEVSKQNAIIPVYESFVSVLSRGSRGKGSRLSTHQNIRNY